VAKNPQAAPDVDKKKGGSSVPAKRPDENVLVSKEAKARWSKKVDDIAKRSVNNAKELVLLHHDVGLLANELRTKPGHWGNHTLEELGKGINWSYSSIQMSATFAKAYKTKAEVKAVVDEGLTWKPLAWLSMIHEPDERAKQQERMVKKEISQSDLQDLVASLNKARKAKAAAKAGKKPPKQKGASPLRVFTSTQKRCSAVLESAGAVRRAFDSYKDMTPGDKQKETTRAVKAAASEMKKTIKELEAVIKLIEKK